MSLLRRRIAALQGFTTSTSTALAFPGATAMASIVPRDLSSAATQTTSSSMSNPTIAPFDTGLDGVNQTNNMTFKDALWWSLGILGFVVLAIRLTQVLFNKLRQIQSMSITSQKHDYWKAAQWHQMPSLKKNLLYAPLWRKRHNREIQLSSAVSIGTLPSRLHFTLLSLYFLSNMFYMLYLDWSNSNHYSLCAEIRGRSGTLALVNMVPLIIFAGRNNPLISMLGVSFDTYNLLHRWIGRNVVFQAIIHTVAWAIVEVADAGWEGFSKKIGGQAFEGSGFGGTVCLVIIAILSLSPLRHAFYETFLDIHIILAFIIFVCTWVHCTTSGLLGNLPQLPWIIAVVMIWIFERLARMLRLAYRNYSASRGFTEAYVEALAGETCRVTMQLPRYCDVKPGTHAYLRFMGINPWESHPFSIAWVDHQPAVDKMDREDKRFTREDIRRGKTTVSFVIGAHTGFTRMLYNKANNATRSIRLRAAMEGPYAGHHQLDSYGHVVLVAGATGITHQLSFLKPLIQGYNEGTIATRRIVLVWVMREYESLEWVRPWMDEILRMPGRREILNVRLFVTRPKKPREIVSQSNTVQMFPGRPNLATLIKKEVDEQVGAMCVTVCGPGALADDVRAAVRGVQSEETVVDFVEESFTW